MLHLGIFGLEFAKALVIEKITVMFQISVLEFAYCKVWCKNKNP